MYQDQADLQRPMAIHLGEIIGKNKLAQKNILVVPVVVAIATWLVLTFKRQTAVTRVGISHHYAKLVTKERMTLMCFGILFPFHRICK